MIGASLDPRSTQDVNIVHQGLPSNIPEHVRRRLMGTSADDMAPWESWGKVDPLYGCSPELRQEISEYSKRHHGKTSQENLDLLCEQKEMNTEMVKQYRFYNQDELVIKCRDDYNARKGRVMHCLEFTDLLSKVRPCYLSANVRKGLSGLAVYHPKDVKQEDGSMKRVDWHYVCGVQVGFMWEYSVVHVDDHGLPLNEKWRGWRTVLLRLIQLEHITEQQALEVFGEPTSAGSKRYLEQLYYWRHRREEDGKPRE